MQTSEPKSSSKRPFSIPPASEALVAETLRLYGRYQVELVEGLNLCPWAKRARLDGQIASQVLLNSEATKAQPLRWITKWSDDQQIAIGLLMFPRLPLSRYEFERFVADLVLADQERMGLRSPSFALAAFHPDAAWDAGSPERLVPFLRRTPDPTIQLVRRSALDRVRRGEPGGTAYFDPSTLDQLDADKLKALSQTADASLRDRIAQSNFETLNAMGKRHAGSLFEDILRDRATTHQRLGGQPSEPR